MELQDSLTSIFLLFIIKNQLNQRWIYGTDE